MNRLKKQNKRLTGRACLLLSLFLFAAPLLGMAAGPKAQAEKPPCFCDKPCAKDSHNTQCPACAADMDLCAAPAEKEPPTACSCPDKCQEGTINPECALCQTDRTQCVGKEPEQSSETETPPETEKPSGTETPSETEKPPGTETPSEAEKPPEAETPSETEEPTKPPAETEKCSCDHKCAAGKVDMACPLCKNDLTICAGQEPATPKFTISILSPEGWHTRKAKVTIRVRDINGTGWETVEAKINSGGSWVDLTDELWEKEKTTMEISENCTVYVTVTDRNGKTHTKNRYIEVFDREPPSLRAGIDGELLRVEASDDLSGVDQIYVCGHSFSDLNNGTLDVRLEDYADHYQQITIQATDNAGNKSPMTQLKNPYYEEPKKETAADSSSATAPPPSISGTAASGGGTVSSGSQKGTGSLSGQTAKADGSGQVSREDLEEKDPSGVSPTAMEETGDNPFTPKGSATVVDNVTDSQGKEFYTIMTPDENVFYLVIDRQRDRENVYFLNGVTERDLMALAQKDTQSQAAVTEPAQEPKEPEPAPAKTPLEPEEPKEEPAPPPENHHKGVLFLVLVVALAGGFGYYIKIYKPRHELDDAEDIDDFDFEGPEEPMVNEDEAECFGEEPKTPDISEEEEAEQRRLYEEDSEDIPIEGDDDLVF